MFRHRSATPAGVIGNGDVRSLGGDVTSILGSAVEREPTRRLPASWRSGASSPGQVNPGEVLIKAVSKNKPKMLSGLNQKVSGQVRGLRISPSRMVHRRPRGTTLPRWIEKVNEVTPLSPREGRLPAKKANGIAGKG